MAKCGICGKVGVMGRNVSHSKRHTPARWLPNVQRHTMLIEGARVRAYACTRCLRTQMKHARTRTTPA